MMNFAGRLGEACSHVAAILTCVIRANVLRTQSAVEACTSKKCAWLPPACNVSLLDTCTDKQQFILPIVCR